MGQDFFHGSVIELGEFLVELSIKEDYFLESVDCGLLVIKWNEDLLTVEASYVIVEWFPMMLLDAVEVSRKLFLLLVTRKLFNKGVCKLSEGGYGVIG